jgi:hypothetical protein
MPQIFGGNLLSGFHLPIKKPVQLGKQVTGGFHQVPANVTIRTTVYNLSDFTFRVHFNA